MTGILKKDAADWFVEHRYTLNDTPISVGVRWAVLGVRRTGPFAPEMANGLILECTPYTDRDSWQAYRQGDYLVLTTAKLGERLPEIPVERPKVRAGTELRWYSGRWEKYSKREGGWTSA